MHENIFKRKIFLKKIRVYSGQWELFNVATVGIYSNDASHNSVHQASQLSTQANFFGDISHSTYPPTSQSLTYKRPLLHQSSTRIPFAPAKRRCKCYINAAIVRDYVGCWDERYYASSE